MNTISEVTKDCTREDCSITGGFGTSTCMAWTPTYDKNGNQTDRGDPNIHSSSLKCLTCGASWWLRTQYGETTIKKADMPHPWS